MEYFRISAIKADTFILKGYDICLSYLIYKYNDIDYQLRSYQYGYDGEWHAIEKDNKLYTTNNVWGIIGDKEERENNSKIIDKLGYDLRNVLKKYPNIIIINSLEFVNDINTLNRIETDVKKCVKDKYISDNTKCLFFTVMEHGGIYIRLDEQPSWKDLSVNIYAIDVADRLNEEFDTIDEAITYLCKQMTHILSNSVCDDNVGDFYKDCFIVEESKHQNKEILSWLVMRSSMCSVKSKLLERYKSNVFDGKKFMNDNLIVMLESTFFEKQQTLGLYRI